MHNEHWLFISNVFAHLVASMSGIASFIIAMVEHARGKKLESWIFSTIGVICLVLAFDQAWQDEHSNVKILTAEKATLWQERDFWKEQSYAKDSSLRKRDELLGQNYNVLAQTQSSLADLSNRLLSLFKSDAPKFVSHWVGTGITGNADGKPFYVAVIVSETNRLVENVNLDLHCDHIFAFQSAIIPSDVSNFSSSGQVTPNSARIVLSTPWNPGTPIVTSVLIEPNDKGKYPSCEVKRHEN